MIKKFRLWLMRVWRWYRHRTLYVIADATDNSITFSRNLFDLLDVMEQEQAKVYVFKLHSKPYYAFAINPPIEQETQLADIQYNTKHKCIGFESLCPTVNRIFYDYGLPNNIKAKLSIERGLTYIESKSDIAKPFTYYLFLPPHDHTAS